MSGVRQRNASLAIVIPVHNRLVFTRNCLAQLQRQSLRGFEVIVIDDGSSDGTSDMIRREFPEVTLLLGDGNLWWTGATNLGVKLALEHGANYVMTLNDDTLPTDGFLENMLAVAEQNPRALIGAASIDALNSRTVFGGERINWWKAEFVDLLKDPRNPRVGLVPSSHLPGRGLLIPAEVFRQIGLFDSLHFPHYAADYDFTSRARRHGFPVYCNYAAALGTYPDASGDHENRQRKGLRNYARHLFHMKGGGNLRVFFWYALRNCPGHLLPICLAVGTARRLLGYPVDWIRETYSQLWSRHASYRKV